MIRITLLVVIGAVFCAGWAWAREQELLNHPASVQMQEFQAADCTPSSNPPGGG